MPIKDGKVQSHQEQKVSGNKSGCEKSFIEKHLMTNVRRSSSESGDGCDSFFVADMGEVYRQFFRWKKRLERVKPFYAVKCNPDTEVLRLLSLLGAGFDCASRGEIERVLSLGVAPSRILYANPCKSISHLRYAQREGISRMTFDGADELYKIKKIFPQAELVLRIMTDDSSSTCRLSQKFGAPLSSVGRLFGIACELGLNIVGVSFHIGSGATDSQLFVQAIQDSRIVFDQGREFGHSLSVLDIGGGFSTKLFESMSETLNLALDNYFPGDIELIAEPGRLFVESAFTLACNIIARRDVCDKNGNILYMLFLSDGVYGNFMDTLLTDWRPELRILSSASEQILQATVRYSIWGPSCDGIDRVLESVSLLKLLDIGDWLYFENMGAYTLCFSTNFNGFSKGDTVYYVSSEPAAKALLHY